MTACSDNVFYSSIFLICSVGYELLTFAAILTPAGVVSHACVIRFVVLPRVSQEPFYRKRVVVVFVKPMQVAIHESSPLLD